MSVSLTFILFKTKDPHVLDFIADGEDGSRDPTLTLARARALTLTLTLTLILTLTHTLIADRKDKCSRRH